MMTEDSYMIPVILHNLKDYDSLLIQLHITLQSRSELDRCHSNIFREILSFQIGNFRLRDRLQFLTASLDTLIESLAAHGRDKFSHTARHYTDSDLGFAKGNYPYEYMDGRANFFH